MGSYLPIATEYTTRPFRSHPNRCVRGTFRSMPVHASPDHFNDAPAAAARASRASPTSPSRAASSTPSSTGAPLPMPSGQHHLPLNLFPPYRSVGPPQGAPLSRVPFLRRPLRRSFAVEWPQLLKEYPRAVYIGRAPHTQAEGQAPGLQRSPPTMCLCFFAFSPMAHIRPQCATVIFWSFFSS